MVNDEQFLKIIGATPLVSIDLVIENDNAEILLGKRINRPAQGFWFVPGGRIRKNEKIAEAFSRISLTELGKELSINHAQLLGAYNHIYDDNYLNKAGINTHYVVLAYKIKWPDELIAQNDSQHSDLKWWSINELLATPNTHQNTKTYFK